MNQKPVIVKTPMSRRRVLVATGGAVALVGTLKLATWAGRLTGPAGQAGPLEQPQGLTAGAPIVAVAVPTGGDWRDMFANRPLLAAVKRALDDVEQAARGRFHLTVEEVAQPKPPKAPATPVPQIMALAPLMASGAPPDLLAFTSNASPAAPPADFALAADARALLPLDDLLKGNTALTLGDFYPSALEVCRHQGKLMGVPLMAAPLLLAYDERRFRSASVVPPDATWGWTQLLDTARRLTPAATAGSGAARDQYGLVPYPNVASLLTLIWQNGGELISADRTRSLLTEPRAREAIEYFAQFYADQPASPPAALTGWTWDGGGVRVNGRWWAAMAQAPAPSILGLTSAARFWPQMPTTAERWEAGFLDWLAMMRDAVSMQAVEHWLPSPMRFVPLPKGRQRASAMGVTATLSVSHSAANPDTAATALALLAERVSQSVVPSARRLSTDVIQRLAPHYTADQAQILADSLADSRALVTGDLQRSAQLRTALWTSLVVPIQAGGTRPLDEKIESANRAIQDILSRP